jgi:hypothetical protein
MIPGPWDKALAGALEADLQPIVQVIEDELACLWEDLATGRSSALNRETRWSIECDGIVERIVTLTRTFGHSTRWTDVPGALLLDGTYIGIMEGAGFEFEQPDMSWIAENLDWAGDAGTER